ncbi:M20/M25/M40 family metallo-hydrolase [Bradyrhizobium sp. U87765 SZCCT0131]|uniref:M20/M25/M40 family metallo-hydrolase n=1 Tax=unclassified Bradyrhizobium TaxID=2631580 RepID=UPI001BAB0DA0|nr:MULTISPECIES: M20/M25/M40 family metallo-hydrolase [unclassified Bradyrhizobium]MBR1218796.1 M20/M25/M40 family metallo-hydrolase [Bradyrhizobium sp. U87765 SZCCT0131]MBR1265445.1 M20/M25/M40 family metallo-hydrolase [Bradyrhizobium sp. U87765 SZCCT0134]MBR1304295.1 M20/M25/M40 family metallo-hydrolase [Bradyrhizobium sp. U87765 SZCCT0110]MBR1319900.1 M20/M25/M40 family metallo-hydrolase [Bradyrhizobium sp. U87765 SZCCT0109]MBR1348226.1 M20/M25/M40 family metallo-hydrolase [Bradyrhizobium s
MTMMRGVSGIAVLSVLWCGGLLPALAAGPGESGAAAAAATSAVLAAPQVIKAFADLKADDARALDEQKRITEIPAPPYKEKVRGEYLLKRFHELGLKDAAFDAEGNVIALRKGSGGGRPRLVVSAHQDTVFPEGTDVTVKERDGMVLAPGIGDDARGLAALLSLIRALDANGITTVGDILFVATVGEEELGNLRGVKALFRDHKDIDGFISIDGLGISRVVNQGTGSHRYEMIFSGPGGHSFQEFGLPSATHALGRAVARIAELRTPADPKTTFTVGTVAGGTSVNAIAAEARMTVDMRSNATEELLKLEATLLGLVKEAVAEENARWNSDKLVVEIKLIGDRPAGAVAEDSPIVQASQRAVMTLTRAPRVTFAGSSTDSNLAMSLGIPAVTIGGGGEGGNWHSRNEWYRPVDAWLGPQHALLTALVLTGLDGVTQPLLRTRP